jgi:hypothetical protein
MTRYRCVGCSSDFEADEPRCPTCHRKTTVHSAHAPPGASLVSSPPAPPAKSSAERHWTANAVLMSVFVALHLLTLASVCINLFLVSWSGSHGSPLGPLWTPPETGAEQAGFYTAFVGIGAWSLVGIVWTPLNAWGLWKKRSWARTSTLVYWIGSLFTCCCVPFGAYGIWSLLRDDVRRLSTAP